VFGPSVQERAAAGVAGNWERSFGAAVPPASDLGAAVLAGAAEKQQADLESALRQLAAQRQSSGRIVGAPQSLNRASGYAVGTIIQARITIYGCTGPGGGFCNNTASGVPVFEGAAACSADLPFGTKLKIHGDPTGRVYECLDRGALKATWIDVFFNNTSDGIAWQSLLGGTIADIEIVN
jgi:3D (Asp-Asp-Asp) domain-containing protein